MLYNRQSACQTLFWEFPFTLISSNLCSRGYFKAERRYSFQHPYHPRSENPAEFRVPINLGGAVSHMSCRPWLTSYSGGRFVSDPCCRLPGNTPGCINHWGRGVWGAVSSDERKQPFCRRKLVFQEPCLSPGCWAHDVDFKADLTKAELKPPKVTIMPQRRKLL